MKIWLCRLGIHKWSDFFNGGSYGVVQHWHRACWRCTKLEMYQRRPPWYDPAAAAMGENDV